MKTLVLSLLLIVPCAAQDDEPFDGVRWGPEQATGRANTLGAGDQPTAWASETPDGQDEWLELEFFDEVTPTAVRIFETFNPGAVAAVSLIDGRGKEIEVWRGKDPTPRRVSNGVSLIPIATTIETKRVKLRLASKSVNGWNEIDAVYLHGPDGSYQYALHATASSTFGRGEERTRFRGENLAPMKLDRLQAFERTAAESLYELWLELKAKHVGETILETLTNEILATQTRNAGRPALETTFAGQWSSSFGPLAISLDGIHATGTYPIGTLQGEVDGTRLEFTYAEEEAKGNGWFALAPDAQSFHGEWRIDGTEEWRPWIGERALPESSKRWLVILEAPWQSGLGDEEYSFGGMLRAIFSHVDGVEVRQRYFTDKESFEAYCRELALLPGEVYLCVATHATPKGLQCQAGMIAPAEVARALAGVPNLKVAHFSACAVMAGELPELVLAARPENDACEGVSGYDISVDWMASALTEFTYFDLLLNRGLSARRAAEELAKSLDFADDEVHEGSAIPAAHFRLKAVEEKTP